MLRTLKPNDIAELPGLLKRNFPEEEALLGTDPEGFLRAARRIERWDARFLLGLMDLFGRPVFRFLVIEVDGRIVATTLLTFSARPSGYISMVTVDGPFRRRGFARQLLHEAAARTKALHRKYVVLDVLETNASARRLYESEGYVSLDELSYLQRPLGGPGPPPDELPLAGIRDLRRSDPARLAGIASAAQRPEVREVQPVEPGDFALAPVVVRALEANRATWVVDDGAGPVAFLRATSSRIMESGHLTAPVLAPGFDPARGAALLRRGVRFLWAEGAKRALVQVPMGSTVARRVLADEGFEEAFRVLTLYRPLAS